MLDGVLTGSLYPSSSRLLHASEAACDTVTAPADSLSLYDTYDPDDAGQKPGAAESVTLRRVLSDVCRASFKKKLTDAVGRGTEINSKTRNAWSVTFVVSKTAV
jgi:hypothetical protein